MLLLKIFDSAAMRNITSKKKEKIDSNPFENPGRLYGQCRLKSDMKQLLFSSFCKDLYAILKGKARVENVNFHRLLTPSVINITVYLGVRVSSPEKLTPPSRALVQLTVV